MTDQLNSALARLRAADSPERGELLGLLVDGLFERPLITLVDPRGLATLVADAFTEAQGRRVAREHVWPGITRYRTLATGAGEAVGDLLPADAPARLLSLLTTTGVPDAPWANGLVDPERVRALVAPVIQETLVRFAKKLPLPGLGEVDGAVGGLADRVRRGIGEGAGRLADVGRSMGKSVMGGFDKKLQSLAKDFSQGALREMREALHARLASEEGRKLLEELEADIVARVLAVPTADILGTLESLPGEPIESLVLATITHNTERALFRRALVEEIEAALAVEGEKTLAELLEEAGALAEVRAFLLGRGDPVLAQVLGDERFGAWLTRLLG